MHHSETLLVDLFYELLVVDSPGLVVDVRSVEQTVHVNDQGE